MSIRLMTAIWKHGPAKQADRMVLLALADYADDAGRCWPALDSLMARACMSDRGVQKVLRRLEDGGWLSIEHRGGRHMTNIYTVNTPNPIPGIDDTETPNVSAETPNPVPKTPNVSAENPEPRSPEPLRTTIEPSIEPLERARDNDSRGPSNDQSDNNPSPSRGTAKANPENGKGHSRSAAKRRSQFSTDWWPSPAGQQFATEHGCQDLAANVAACIDHHIAKGSVFADHDRAWQTWCRNAVRYGWTTNARGGSNHRGSKAESERSAYADRLLAATIEAGDARPQTPDRGRFDA